MTIAKLLKEIFISIFSTYLVDLIQQLPLFFPFLS